MNEIAPPQTPTDPSNRSRTNAQLVQALEEYMKALEAGQAPDRTSFLAQHADIAGALGECLEGLEFICSAASRVHNASELNAISADPDASLATARPLGDFQILREVGRGGMGVVYEAIQLSLGRRVALKILPFASTLDSRQLHRFKNEAQAAACLHHTNIVPVFATGAERGVHYYAMQFIDGCTLAEVLRALPQIRSTDVDGTKTGEGPSASSPLDNGAASIPTALVAELTTLRTAKAPAYFRRVATLGIVAAEALEHAHETGIVHRDIKPGNLMIDVRGKLWIMDFGLAQVQNDAKLTVSGDLIGTLRYMSPEQALGNRATVDHRTDIYSLGATLYEALTLQPAVRGNDKREVLHSIAFEEPKTARKISRSVPVELETIVLKCLDKEPASRYGSARELAEDLRRFLMHEPIRARRANLPRRLAKWSRRHQGAVMAALVVLSLMVIALSFSARAIWNEQRNTRREQQKAIVEKERAEAHLDLSLLVLDEVLLGSAEETTPKQSQLTSKDREIFQKGLEFFERIALQEGVSLDGAGRDVRARVGRLYARMGRLRSILGSHAEARLALERALAIQEKLAQDEPGNAQCRRDLAHTYLALANTLRTQGDISRAESFYQQVVQLWEQLVIENPDKDSDQTSLAAAHADLASVHAATGRLPEAERGFDRALKLQEQVIKRPQEDKDLWRAANTYKLVGQFRFGQRRFDDAEKAYAKSAEILQKLVDARPDNPQRRNKLAEARNNQAGVLYENNNPDAIKHFRQTIAEQEVLVGEFPAVPDFQYSLAALHMNLGSTLRRSQQLPEAETAFRNGLQILVKLDARFPDLPSNRQLLADARFKLANALAQMNQHSEATQLYQQALAEMKKLVSDYPLVVQHQETLVAIYRKLGIVYVRTHRWPDAVDCFRSAIQLRQDDAATYHNLGVALQEMGRLDEAVSCFREATRLQPDLVVAHDKLAQALHRRGNLDDAVAAYMELLRIKPDDAAACANLGATLASQGKLDEAIAMLKRAARLEPGRWEFSFNLGRAMADDDQPSEAIAAYAEALRLKPDAPQVLNALSWVLSTASDSRLRDPARAVDLATRAVELKPKDGSYWNTLGIARFRKGEWASAVEALHQSVQLRNGGDGHDFFFLAMSCWHLARQAEARQWSDKAVEWMDKNKPQDAAVGRLQAETERLLNAEAAPAKNRDGASKN